MMLCSNPPFPQRLHNGGFVSFKSQNFTSISEDDFWDYSGAFMLITGETGLLREDTLSKEVVYRGTETLLISLS